MQSNVTCETKGTPMRIKVEYTVVTSGTLEGIEGIEEAYGADNLEELRDAIEDEIREDPAQFDEGYGEHLTSVVTSVTVMVEDD
jgi:hypothetical protein